jgi:hypothetical protein
MKQAKKRPLPTLAKLVSSTKRANRAMTGALASVVASNKRIAKKEKLATNRRPKYRLEDLMAEIPAGTRFEEIDWGPPVGKEIL